MALTAFSRLLILFALVFSVYGSYTLSDRLDEAAVVVSTLRTLIMDQQIDIKKLSDTNTRLKTLLDRFGIASDKPVFSKTVTVTSYTSRPEETDDTPYITANNTNVRPGGIAVSRDLLELLGGFGAEVTLDGYGSFTVNDVMNKRYTDSVDVWAGSLEAARRHGRRTATMIWQ